MSLREYNRWAKYRRERGSLNVGARIERSVALLTTIYANRISKDGGFKLADFLPHERAREVSLEEAMEAWV
ncbi:phage tail assembly protein T [Pseudomonas sp. CFBP 8772]|uniref:phage tail assembly protein T n=1 Tax=Pseudomonas sp. CFBP 8772 TaxID=2775284 RepID=UPI00406D0C97